MKKRLIMILCIAIGILFVSCKSASNGTDGSQKQSVETQGVSLQTEKEKSATDTSEESLETTAEANQNTTEEKNPEKKILIYGSIEKQACAEIRDEQTVQQIMDALKKHQDWKIVPEKEYVSAEPEYYIDCQNGIAFYWIQGVNYVAFGTQVTIEDGEYRLSNAEEPLRVMPKDVAELLRTAMNQN